MKKKLKPCPFCGGETELITFRHKGEERDEITQAVSCGGFCKCLFQFGIYKNKEKKTAELFNMRKKWMNG